MRNQQDNGNRYQFRLHPAQPITTTTATSIQPRAAASSLVTTETTTLATMATTAAAAATTTLAPPVLEQTLQQKKQTIINKLEEQEQQNSCNTNINTQNCHNTNKQQQQQEQQQHSGNNSNNNHNNNNNNNNKNSNNIDNTNTTTAKCITTASVVLEDSNSNDAPAAANLLHRKQFVPISDICNASFSSASVSGSIQDDISNSDQCGLTQAGLEEYNIRASSYYDQPVLFHHQKQSSYAQSEGYHSYVSSSDSSSATPFLDRLRQESELLSRQSSHHWSSQNDLSSISCNSVAASPIPLLLTTIDRDINGGSAEIGGGSSSGGVIGGVSTANHHQQHNNSSESTSSTETLKWLGSMSDVSEASHGTGYSAISESVSSSQLIVHSSRVLTPKRHHSESVLYLNDEQQHSPDALQQQQQSPIQMSPSLRETLAHSPTATTRPIPNHRHSPSYPPVHTSLTRHPYQQHQPQQQHIAMPPATAKREVSAADLPNSSLDEAAAESSFTSAATKSTIVIASAAAAPTSVTSADLQNKSSISVTISNSEAVLTISPQSPPPTDSAQPVYSVSSSDLSPSPNVGASSMIVIGDADSINAAAITTTALSIATGAVAASDNATPSAMPLAASSPLAAAMNASSYRSNHRLFPVSTYAEPVHSNTSQFVHHPKAQYSAGLQKPVVPQQQQQQPPQVLNVTTAAAAAVQQQQPIGQAKYSPSQASPQQQQTWQSVAELINDFERTTDQQPLKYAYIEPSKTHRISNPALKAFQKNAVQSYFERQQHQQHQHQQQHSKDHSQQQKLYQPHSVHHHMQQQQQQQQQQQLMRPHSYQSLASNKETGHQLLRNSLPNTYGSPATCQQQHHQQQLLNSSICGMQASQISSPPKKPEDKRVVHAFAVADSLPLKPASPAPPPPPPRSRSLMPTLLRRSSSASDYGEFRDQYTCAASQEKLQAQSIKNISSSEKLSFNDCGMPPPPPPPRGRTSALPPRRTSSASEYAAAMRDKAMLQQAAALAHQQHHPHQHNNHQPPLPRNNNANHHYYTTASAATMVAPPLPSTDSGWVPERPPKNPNLRVPSPDLPPPPADVDTNLSDEPLPPPPPEILHRQQQHYYDGVPNTSMTGGELLPPKAPSPNRRNSFAGSSTRKSFFSRTATSVASEAPSKVPPMIPKKPTNIELLHLPHPPASVAAHHSNKAHKVLLNGGLQHHQQLRPSPPPPLPQSATKANANRKRPHHPAMISVPPILENTAIVTIKATTIAANSPAMSISKSSTPPPPLMPRSSAFAAINHKQRCNSKASYLPRQSLEKLNNSDPDHGSYKLMLTSNEDLVGNTKTPAYDILAHSNGKIPNNLPDVLPLGAKLQPHPASPSPTSANSSPLRYGSNNSLANTMNSSSIQHQQQQPHQASTCYPMYPMQHRYSTPAMHSSYNSSSSSNNTHVPNYNRSQSFDVHASNNNNSAAVTAGTSPTKFMSQSTIDLKKTHHLEPTLEETMCETTAKILSPAQSENNLSSSAGSPSRRNPLKSTTASKPLSPCSAKREFHRLDSAEEQRPDPAVEGRIFRAELVSTTLATSPCTAAHNSHKSITRKDSLRENIEKITQLQSKLMSAHLSDSSSLVSVYGSKPSLSSPIPASKPQATATEEPNATSEQSHTNAAEIKQQQFLENFSRPEHQRCISAEITSNDSFSPPPQTSTITSLPQQKSANEYEQSDDDDNANAEIIATQISQMDSTIDGLKLMQRSELILHVNPNTTEVASQTDDLPDCDMGRLTAVTPQHNKEDSQARYSTTTLQPRQRLPIEVDCDNMFKELASLLSPNDKLIEILIPTIIKSPTDYIANLYNPNVPCRPAKRDVGTSTLMRMHRGGEIRESPERGGGKMITVELQYAEVEVLLTNGSESDGCDLMKKKVDDLIKHLNRKIRILNKEQTMISEEIAFNDELGSNLISKLTDKVRPIEATKFRTYIDDIGHITSLLLSLSERLARSENSLSTITDNSAEKKTLESKRDRLLEQLDEAKRLKEDIDRRGSSVIVMLEKNLSADDFADFDYFINMKAKLIADARDIADKVKCGEEQLNSLSEALIQSDC